MALMKFREANRVLWWGVRPAHDGTQVCKAFTQLGVGTADLYQVAIGMTFFLTYAHLGSRESADADGFACLSTEPIGEGAARRIITHYYDVAGHQSDSATFNPPIEIATGVWVRIIIDHDNIDARACIHGWLE